MKIKLRDNYKEFDGPLKGIEIAHSISPSLAKNVLALKVNGELKNYDTVISNDCEIEFITKDAEEAFEILNHSTAHLFAEALKELYPEAKFGVGPAIEEGFYYDFDIDTQLSVEDFAKIEAKMKELSKKAEVIERVEVSKKEALDVFSSDPYKKEIISELEEGAVITLYKQGSYTDLCRGPHVPKTNYISNFKLLSIAGAYWRGDSKNKMLQRIYGVSFFSKEALDDYLNLLEERKKRDHRKLGKDLGLFMMSEYGPGFPFWLPKGMLLRRTLENFWFDVHKKNGYFFIQTPTMLNRELWETSGHWFNYKENMYTSVIDEKDFAIKPMNCPGGMLVYKNSIHSYRDFPLRLGELGLVHRHEASGALNGLFRVRCFTQDDAHIFITEDQIEEEISRLIDLYDYMYQVFGLSYHIELSTRPEDKYIGSLETWNKAEAALASAMEKKGIKYILNPGDGAFYGPKLDFKLKDSMNRIWQCGTIQLDMNLPERFDLTYIAEDGSKKRPIMLHRALFGSIERFIGILIEHFSGAFPLWLAPTQVEIIPVNLGLHSERAKEISRILEDNHIRTDVDLSEEKLGYKIRLAQTTKIPYSLVIGDAECQNGSVTFRKYGEDTQVNMSLDEFIELLNKQIKELK